MFLNKTDFSLIADDQEIEELTAYSAITLDTASLLAEAEMLSYLNASFDMATAFAATAENRNRLLVMYGCDIAIYHLCARMAQHSVPDIREKRYDTALEWLKMVSQGKLTPPLPLRPSGADGSPQSPTRFGGNPKFIHQY